MDANQRLELVESGEKGMIEEDERDANGRFYYCTLKEETDDKRCRIKRPSKATATLPETILMMMMMTTTVVLKTIAK
jgi:hypothetical protein